MTSYGGISSQDTESISRRLRDAERARAEAERAHSEALSQLRNARANLDSLAVEQLQSRVRELEKKAALETVKCEELQLELSASMRARSGISGHVAPTTVTWAPPQPASEIDRIMAKIEQDNRILAELEHSRGTTIGMQQSGSNPGLGEYPSPSPSPLPHSYTGVSSHIPICQSSTMPTLSSHANQFTMPNSNSMAYSMSGAHNSTAYGNPMPPYSSANTYGFPNAHQVTFTNPVTAPSVSHNLSQISSALAGIQSNMQNLTLGSGLTGTMSGVHSGLSGLNTVPTCLSSGLTSTLGGLSGGLSNPLSALGATHLSGLSTSLAGTGTYGVTGTYTNPLLSSGLTSNQMNIKLKPLDEIDMALGRYGGTSAGVGRVATPVTPHQPSWNLGLDSQYGADRMDRITGLNTGFTSDASRGLSRILPNSGLDIDARNQLYMNGGAAPEGTVDMLDLPGKGRCGVYIARFSYEPPDVEGAESELPICAGDYLLVWGPLDTNATMLDAETLDGRRGLVPATFLQRLIGDDLLEFHQAAVATFRDADETGTMIASEASLSRDVARLSEMADLGEGPEDDDNIPAPRQLTLERQLNKSVLIGWTAPEGVQQFNIDSYHVYVDGTLKTTIKATERTRALVEGVDANRPHRISVRSVTGNRRTSRDAACTMVIGRDTANMGPTCVRASNVTCSSAIISWLPANSNHQHVVCVNNVEVRTVKPGVYRHTITGLAPSTQYRVTVRAKHLRAGPPQPGTGAPVEEAPGAYTDFRTLPKGLPDPPNEIMVEAGPQDGTLLVTWQPVQRPPASGPVTGYAVYADGKKVTDVDSPTGDHALIDIGKLLSMNPRCVTVRTKSRDSQSSDSIATPIPPQVLRGIAARMQRNPNQNFQRMPQGRGPQPYPVQQHHQQVIEHDENLSDKEIYPTANRLDPTQPGQPASGFGTGLLKSIFDKITPSQSGIPAIEITKEAQAEICSEDEICEPQRERRRHTQQQTSQPQQVSQQQSAQQYQTTGPYHGTPQPQYQQPGQGPFPNNQHQYPGQQFQNPPPKNHLERGRTPNPQQTQQGPNSQFVPTRGVPGVGPRTIGPRQQGPPQQIAQVQPQKRCRNFVAIYDYDPQSMSPNPDSADEELPFTEGDEIKIWGEKDADGFYWGECKGRRGYVPHNMVVEVEPSGSNTRPRERWSDSYAAQPVKRMVALYDYDPQELSPNVDADAELSFQTGQIITVYGDMDDDGFFMAEIEGVRGLVPSNFLTEAPLDQYGGSQNTGQAGPSGLSRGGAGRGRGQGPGPGARGPPPPPRDNIGQNPRPQQRKADACPLLPSQLDHNTSVSNPEQAISQQVLAAPRGRGAGVQPLSGLTTTARTSAGNTSTPTLQSPAQTSLQQMQQQMQQPSTSLGQMGALNSPASAAQPGSPATRRGGPSVVPQPVPQPLMQQPPAAQPVPGQPNLMQKFTEITAPGGDILSKGKELIFMKFGLGGK